MPGMTQHLSAAGRRCSDAPVRRRDVWGCGVSTRPADATPTKASAPSSTAKTSPAGGGGTAVWKVEDGSSSAAGGDPKRGACHDRQGIQGLRDHLGLHDRRARQIQLRRLPPPGGGKGERPATKVNIGRAQAGEYTGGIFTDRWLAKGDEKTRSASPGVEHLAHPGGGRHMIVHLNGKLVADYTDPKPPEKFVGPGVIGLPDLRAPRDTPGGSSSAHPSFREIK